jgi:hypothetical protein
MLRGLDSAKIPHFVELCKTSRSFENVQKDCKECDSAEKVFFRKSEKNISHTDALYRTIGPWLIIFFIPNFRE